LWLKEKLSFEKKIAVYFHSFLPVNNLIATRLQQIQAVCGSVRLRLAKQKYQNKNGDR